MDAATAKHGDIDDMPADWKLRPLTCDWGDCNKLAVKARFDGSGHGWLPVCHDCALKPIDIDAGIDGPLMHGDYL